MQFNKECSDVTAPKTNVGQPSNVYDKNNISAAQKERYDLYNRDGMTSGKLWEYDMSNYLNNSSAYIQKDWANAGKINGRRVTFHEKFHDFVPQKNADSRFGYTFVISDNPITNVDVYNMNFKVTFWFTYEDGSIVPISQMGTNQASKNGNNSIFYFMTGSLTSQSDTSRNRREYAQTNDANTVLISKDPIHNPETGFTSDPSSMGLDTIVGSGDGVTNAYTNTKPLDYQSNDNSDTNPDYYALQDGVTFTDFTTDMPTFSLGAVPIHADQPWWHGNHNMNSDLVSFTHYNVVGVSHINETIDYVDQSGKQMAPQHKSEPVTFVTVKSWDGQIITYYKKGYHEEPDIDENGVPDNSWIRADNYDFDAVKNPDINNYHVISNDAPNSDLSQVSKQGVNSNSEDLHFTVVYAPAYTIETSEVNETVTYVDTEGNQVADPASAKPIHFMTVKNPVDGTSTTYYSTTTTDTTLDPNTGVPSAAGWNKGDNTQLLAIMNPNVPGYHVVETTDPSGDLTQIPVKVVDSGTGNLNYKVTYAANKPVNPDEPNKPDKPVNPDEPNKPDKPVNPDEPNKPDKPVNPDEPNKPDKPVNPDKPNILNKPMIPNKPAYTEPSVLVPNKGSIGKNNTLSTNNEVQQSQGLSQKLDGSLIGAKLPKTGVVERRNNFIFAGMMMLTISVIVWLSTRRKKDEQ
ncbi:mucin-binding protein [Weissella bombi]|uniref:mucin-binding protein n=1 Tax=Weissella bombi TaxID=1505725 RepID=UPI0010F52A30|nr:LPXTG cell wall anchor domain-containing protein [Weissella bombi]